MTSEEIHAVRSRRTFGFICAGIGLLNLIYGYTVYSREYDTQKLGAHPDSYTAFRRYLYAADRIEKSYIDAPKSHLPNLLEYSLVGMTGGLDPFCRYSSPEQVNYNRRIESEELCGIGVELGINNRMLEILAVQPGSSAQLCGLEEGDLITHIDGVSVEGFDLFQCRNLIIGERGTPLTLTLEESDGQRRHRKMIRSVDPDANVSGPYMTDSHIALVRIAAFTANTAADFERALRETVNKGCTGMVMDLRGCPGGRLDELLKIADLLLDSGSPIVTLTERGTPPKTYRAATGGLKNTLFPLAVLVDPNTASSAEILAAALKDNSRAVIIGEPTYGKGFVQDEFSLPDGGSITITTANYLTAGGYSINNRGIEPTFYIPLTHPEQIQIARQRVRYPGKIHPDGGNWLTDKTLEFALSYLNHLRKN